MLVKAKNLTIASLVVGSVGLVIFLFCKTTKGKKSSLKMISKLMIAIGVFLLAGAVYEISENETKENESKEKS